jgi:hypothetical protein
VAKKGHTEEQILRALAAGGERHAGSRHLPGARGKRSDLLRLEEEIRRAGFGGIARTSAVA